MRQHSRTKNDERCTDLMFARCRKLSLPCFRLGDAHDLRLDDAACGDIGDFLSSPAMGQLIKGAAASQEGREAGEPIKLFEGCWLLPLDHFGSSGTPVALFLADAALTSGAFQAACAGAGIEAARMRERLMPWVQHGMNSPERLAAVLRWTREDLEAAERQDGLLREFSNKLIQSYEETHVLFRIMRFMASTGSPRQQVQLVCNQILQILPFRWVAVLFRDQDRVEVSLRGQLIIAGDVPGDARGVPR